MKYIKHCSLIAVPITLMLSLKLNSLNILLCLLLFFPDVIKNIRQSSKIENRLFFALQAFVLCYLIGTLVDFYYGIHSLKKLERLLPFIVLPIIFLYGRPKSLLADKKLPLKVFAVSTTILGVVMVIHYGISHYMNYKDVSLLNKRWKVSGLDIQPNEDEKFEIETFKVQSSKTGLRRDITYDRSIVLGSDTSITRSFYAKSDEDVWLLVRQYDGQNHLGAWFNIRNGELGFVQREVMADIIPVQEGWFRVVLTNKIKKETFRERVQITVVKGNKSYQDRGEEGIKFNLSVPQLEFGSSPTEHNPLIHRDFGDEFDRNEILTLFEGHPTYFSMYLVFSVVIYLLVFNWAWSLKLLVILLNFFMIFILGSKAAILSLVILSIYASSQQIFKLDKRKVLMLFGGITTMLAITVYMIPGIWSRFAQMFLTVTGDMEGKGLSSGIRLEIWHNIFQLAQKNIFLGHGNLYAYNLLSNMTNVDVNSHSQYFEAILCSGLLGLLFLVAYLFLPMLIRKSILSQKLFGFFLLLVAFNLFFETMLNRQWGIVFVSYFMAYFCFMPTQKSENG